MGGATNCPETPRQKMIGMMYLVLTAMLAMNVSADILLGFKMVEESLQVNTKGAQNRNINTMAKFQSLCDQNPGKIGPWMLKAKQVQVESDKLFQELEDLKIAIVEHADGKSRLDEYGVYKRKSLEGYEVEATSNLDAAGWVCLEEGGPRQGKKIREAIEKYREFLINTIKRCDPHGVGDTAKINMIKKTLNTEKTYSKHADAKVEWEEARFEMQPVAAVTTLLSKSQADVRNLQGDVVTFLKSMVDADDFRVNKIQAQIIPVSQYVTQGDKYKAQIILSASDSTKQPEVYVGGTKISEGKYEVTAGKIGESKFSGYIKMFKPDGTSIQYPFDGSYFTSAPSATISADKMNVFYAGIDNDISVSVPGYPSSLVTATISGAQLRTNPRGGYFVSGARAGVSCEITAYAKVDGKQKVMGKKTFRVKPLPPPIAFIPLNINGNYSKYKGSPDKIKKVNLLNVTELQAELNDADIEAHFEVVGFELNISSAMGSQILPSSSSKFTTEQLNYLKTVSSGKKFFIGNIRAIGPDKVVKPLPPMEVVIN